MTYPIEPIATFDAARFREDVRDFCKRQEIRPIDLARMSGISHFTIKSFLRRHRVNPSAVTMAALSYVTDLSLDSYVEEFHGSVPAPLPGEVPPLAP